MASAFFQNGKGRDPASVRVTRGDRYLVPEPPVYLTYFTATIISVRPNSVNQLCQFCKAESEPRNLEVPATRIEDISCAIDYLSTLPQVDVNNTGVLGICAGGGYALSAAQIDPRIKAVATVSLFDLGEARREGVDKSVTFEQRMKRVQQMAEQRTKEARGEAVLM